MKTTVELPDDLLIEAKKFAVEIHTTLRALVEDGLRRVLSEGQPERRKRKRIKWVTSESGVPEALNVADRRQMMEFLLGDRLRY